jgi:hypothetical protein
MGEGIWSECFVGVEMPGFSGLTDLNYLREIERPGIGVGNLDEASVWIDRGIAIMPQHREKLRSIEADFLQRVGDLEGALKAATRSIPTGPFANQDWVRSRTEHIRKRLERNSRFSALCASMIIVAYLMALFRLPVRLVVFIHWQGEGYDWSNKTRSVYVSSTCQSHGAVCSHFMHSRRGAC